RPLPAAAAGLSGHHPRAGLRPQRYRPGAQDRSRPCIRLVAPARGCHYLLTEGSEDEFSGGPAGAAGGEVLRLAAASAARWLLARAATPGRSQPTPERHA